MPKFSTFHEKYFFLYCKNFHFLLQLGSFMKLDCLGEELGFLNSYCIQRSQAPSRSPRRTINGRKIYLIIHAKDAVESHKLLILRRLHIVSIEFIIFHNQKNCRIVLFSTKKSNAIKNSFFSRIIPFIMRK